MSSTTKPKKSRTRQILWFVGLYGVSLLVVGAFSFGARLLLGLPV